MLVPGSLIREEEKFEFPYKAAPKKDDDYYDFSLSELYEY